MSSQTKVTFWRQKVLHTLTTMKVTPVFLAVLIAYTCVFCPYGSMATTTLPDVKREMVTERPIVSESVKGTLDRCSNEAVSGNINDTFLNLCSSRDRYLSCLKEGLPRTFKLNENDFILSLNFDFDIASRQLKSLCSTYGSIKTKLECINKTRLKSCQTNRMSDYKAIFKAYQTENTPLEVLRQRSCKVSDTLSSCMFNALPSCPQDVRQFSADFSKPGFSDKCNGGHNVNSLSGIFVAWLLLCLMFSSIWNDV